jgi:hypothetical protein
MDFLVNETTDEITEKMKIEKYEKYEKEVVF